MRKLDDRLDRMEPLAALALAVAEGGEGGAFGASGVIEALLEAMFLMAIADGEVCEEEIRQFARSCERLLGEITEGDVEGMFLQWASLVAEEGWERRMRAIAGAAAGTPLAEPAFRLSVAIALADERVASEEVDGIDLMAQALGIDPGRSQEIMREVQEELFGEPLP